MAVSGSAVAGQMHLNRIRSFKHVALFSHGFGMHFSTSVKQQPQHQRYSASLQCRRHLVTSSRRSVGAEWNTSPPAFCLLPSLLPHWCVARSILTTIVSVHRDFYFRVYYKAVHHGHRSRGWQRQRWSEDISEWTVLHTSEAERTAEDRGRWRSVLLAANTSENV